MTGVIGLMIGLLIGNATIKLGCERSQDTPPMRTAARELAQGEPVEIIDLPSEIFSRPYRLEQITINQRQEASFITQGISRNMTYQGHRITDLEFSPILGDKAGFFYYPYGNATTDIALAIMNIPKHTVKEVYRKSVRTSGWEWDGTKRVIVYYNCGTGCLYAYKIDVETSKIVDEYLEYEVSPVVPQQTDPD
ncbi:MAG: hypothetical protein AB1352_03865 [Patescibacteria group bacterium]